MGVSSDAFIATAIEAGLLALSTPGAFEPPSTCIHEVSVHGSELNRIKYSGPQGRILALCSSLTHWID